MIRCTCFDYKTAKTHTYFMSGFHLGKFCKKNSSGSQNSVTHVTTFLSYFSTVLRFYAKISTTLVCSSRQQYGERKWFTEVDSGENVFETMEGILYFSVFQIQRYGCHMANPNHRTDIKHVPKTIIFTSNWTMRAWVILMCFQFAPSKGNLII